MARRQLVIQGPPVTSDEVGKILGVTKARMAKLTQQTAALFAKAAVSGKFVIKSTSSTRFAAQPAARTRTRKTRAAIAQPVLAAQKTRAAGKTK